ncbi:MAG TPA: agmatine deiminase family protein [Chitinophagaceae bacterium]|nr:agmatine deiminase family protein [Chitinophagaceae bacterium]
MLRGFLKRILIVLVFFPTSCSDNPKNNKEASEPNFYTQSNTNRVAAEWEPVTGTMIVWPLCIPYKLVIELAKDNHLFTLVENEDSKKEALRWYTKWGIDSSNNTFIYAPQGIDSWWVRDWGPSAVFTPDGKMKLADGKYIYSTPVTKIECDDSLRFLYTSGDNAIIKTETDDNATQYLGKGLNIELLDLPFINTGGNVLTDGLGTAFSTCILVNENQFFGVAKEKFLDLNKKLLGFDRYNIVSNFEKGGVQHIDCYMKLLDEERILVAEPPKDHGLFQIYENIVQNELKKLKSPYGRPYQILRIKTGQYKYHQLAAYTNSLILNKTIYVPLFHIKEDSIALKRWHEVMPGYTIKGFGFEFSDQPLITPKMRKLYSDYGWNFSDALHCRTRAVWDSQMLFISTKRIDAEVDSKHSNIVYATIIDYSKKGLQKEQSKLFWRVSGEMDWNTISLNQIENTNHFLAEIPFNKSDKTIEYYVSAASQSGRKETQPRTAPKGTYQFMIK